MSPLARVASLAAIATGTFVATAVPAVAQSSTPSTPSEQATSAESGSPSVGESSQESSSASQTPSTSETPSASSVASAQDIQYLRQAHRTNLAEIAAGQLAQQKGNSQTVRNLGGKFVTDHTKLDHALVPVAQSLNVSLPSTPSSAQQAVYNQLKARSGTQFDNLFVTSQFARQTQAIRAGQTEIASGSNPKVVTLARESQPVIESDRQALVAAAQQLGIVLPTASASTVTPVPSGTVTPVPSGTVTPVPSGTVTLAPAASPTNTNS